MNLLLHIVLTISAAQLLLCGSVADLDTEFSHTVSSKQLTSMPFAVSVTVVVRGGWPNRS